MTLGEVPGDVWDALASYRFDAVWLMGVWERSPAGLAVSMRNESLLAEFRRLLPDFTAEDNVGSAYCVKQYAVDARLGGRQGLAAARKEVRVRVEFFVNRSNRVSIPKFQKLFLPILPSGIYI